MKIRITIIMLVLATLVSNAQTSTKKEFLNTVDKNTLKRLQDHKVPGLALAIIKNGKVFIKKGYGYSNVAKEKKVNVKTGFNIGSISKMFTAWGVMKLVEEGKLNLDAPYSNYVSNWKLPSSEFNESKVTIRNLLQHTAGLSVRGYNGYETQNELSSLKSSLLGKTHKEEEVKLIMQPESKWKYSGGGYSVLQLVIEEVSGKTFANYMEETIFKPLKMKHTSFIIDKQVLKRSAKAYDENGKQIPLRLFNAQAAAGLHTTLNDLVVFALASMNKNIVLSEKSIAELTKPTELSRGDYGMGYMVMNRFGNFTLTGHGGSNEGWHSGFMLDFKSKSGIIILTNGDSGRNVLFGNLKDWAKWHSSN